jgi:hypothetical protein
MELIHYSEQQVSPCPEHTAFRKAA